MVIALGAAACASGPPPEATPVPLDPESADGRRVALTETWTTLDTSVAAIAHSDEMEVLDHCEVLGEQIASLWASTRRAAIDEALKRAVPRPGDPVPAASKRREDDLLVNFTTEGYAELAALSYRLRWGGWREAGSTAVLEHLLKTTGISLVAIKASCDPYVGEFTATAECHANVAFAASVIGLGNCP